MKYIIYSYEIIDGDIDFVERLENKGEKSNVAEALSLADELDKKQKEIRFKGEDLRSIVHRVYDENDHLITNSS